MYVFPDSRISKLWCYDSSKGGGDMAWFSRFTRFGDVHLVYGQEANMSCGIASIIMCVFKINKLKPGTTAITVEKELYKEYEAVTKSKYDAEHEGTYPRKLARILNGYTKGHWRWHKT